LIEIAMTTDTQSILDQLQSLISSDFASDVAGRYRAEIKEKQDFLANKSHPIFFIGKVGIGKSSLIGIASKLLTDPTPPKDKNTLRQNSVLATGSGRTTVCEVHVIKSNATGNHVTLKIDPVSQADMQREIRLYAEEAWDRITTNSNTQTDTSSDVQEVQRFIRNMTGYADTHENVTIDGIRRRRVIRPFEDEANKFDVPENFVNHMIAAAQLDQRTKTEWVLSGTDVPNLTPLKDLFDAINQGNEAQALLPQKITIALPDVLPDSNTDLDVELVDTRGLDGSIEARADLQACLRDPRALFVLCSSFNDAPNDSTRAVLDAMASDVRFHSAIARSILLLVDADNAMGVNDAGGDREYGQMLKLDECMRALGSLKLNPAIGIPQLIAFDVLQDDRLRLVQKFDQQLLELRRNEEHALNELVQEASDFIQHIHDEARPKLEAEVESAIKIVLGERLSNANDDGSFDAPVSNPMIGIYTAIENSHPASRVYASCRRAGKFRNLDLYAATRSYATRESSAWIISILIPVRIKLAELYEEPRFNIAKDVIQRYWRAYDHAAKEVVNDYANAIGTEIENLLLTAANDVEKTSLRVWQDCCNEWGKGDGFKIKVITHIKNWARKQFFRAHETTTALEKIPFLKDVKPPEKAPKFKLKVKNLRALKQVEWSPAEVCLLIGANGAGKTTLLKCLRFLRLAYESSLPDAVKVVFGGSYNLRNWYAKEDEVIEISLEIDQAIWSFELTPLEGAVDYRNNERFLFNGEEIFARNSLGELTQKGVRMEDSDKLALRTIIERGLKLPILNIFVKFLKSITYFSEPDLAFFRKNGSNTEEDKELHPNGGNALTMLRSWYNDLSNRHRFDFVIDGLRAAFPKQINDLGFKEAGKTLVARINRPDRPTEQVPLEDEANGMLQMVILLCALANAQSHSVIEIDEPENSLHPYAVRAFLRQAMTWARKHHVTVLLATHSIVLLDEFNAIPEKVYVMKEGESSATLPSQLDQLYDRDWLDCFRLGDLFERDELVSNEDEN
jgi:predicted ATPase